MNTPEHIDRPLTLVDPDERLALRIGASTLFYRRLSLGALAALERQQTILTPGQAGGDQRPVLPPAALEAAVCSHCLIGWQGVMDINGGQAPFDRHGAGRLPAMVRRLLSAAAHGLEAVNGR